MASGTLERCFLYGWIPVFTIQGRCQTARMASCGWAVCWCQRCGSSGPWWRWGYGMGRHMFWTTSTGAFYWWHFECTEIPWRDPEAHCWAIHPQPSPHVARICTQFLEAENISVLEWPAYSPDLSPIEHVWDALDRHIRQRVPVPANIQQLHTAIKVEWTNIPQATINNLINSMQRRCVAMREENGGHILTGFRTPLPHTLKLHILDWPFIVVSLRKIIFHTCEVDGLSRQRRRAHKHRFRQICEQYLRERGISCRLHRKSQLMKKFSSWKMGGKQKCYVYNFVQCSYDIAGDHFHVPCNIIQIALKRNNIETLWSFLSEMLMV